jgi:DNA-binding NarL/FixJ family response regulator
MRLAVDWHEAGKPPPAPLAGNPETRLSPALAERNNREVADAAVPAAGTHAQIVGRDAELACLAAFVGAVASAPCALVLRGPAGIGKTILWRDGVDQLRRAGAQVLVTRPAEEEMPLALVGLVDLFEPVGVDTAVLRAGDDTFARGRAVLAELRRLAARAPTVLAVDDLQWLDEASARALRHALRRVTDEPIGVLATLRTPARDDDPLTLARALPPERCDTVDVRRLSLGALRSLLGRRVGSISRPVLRRIQETSDGNPLYALELAHALTSTAGVGGAWARLPLPASLQAAIADRLETAPAELAPVLEVAAAVGRPSVAELRAALPDLDVERLLELASSHELLVVEEDLTVRFAHPLIGSAVYERLGPLARRSLHAALAERATDPDARARHLALSRDLPDEAAATELEEAARRAGDRGAPELAAEFAQRSVELTPADDADARLRRALAAVGYRAAAGEVATALSSADALIAALPPGPRRAEVLARRVFLDLEQGEPTLERALAEAEGNELLRGELLDLLGWLRGTFRGDLDNGLACAREAAAIGERLADRRLTMLAEASIGVIETLRGLPDSGRIARAVAVEPELGAPPLGRRPPIFLARKQLWDGDLENARAGFERMRQEFLRAGTEFQRPYRLYDLALAEYGAGELARAVESAHEGADAAVDAQNEDAQPWLLYPLALAEAALGRRESAQAGATRLLEWSAARGEPPGVARARSVLGLLALSEGDAEVAARELGEAARLLGRMGIRHPGAHPALADVVEALAASGDGEAAAAALQQLEATARVLGTPWPVAAAARARGHVLVLSDADAAAAELAAADAAFAQLGYRLDAARAAFARGRALIRAGRRRAAADVVADARERFAEMGAAGWEARAGEELERAAPGRADGELTATERRVAALVAEGRKNREIGQSLFMSVATVEAHLTRIYRKLDLRSRSELARLVAEGAVRARDDKGIVGAE